MPGKYSYHSTIAEVAPVIILDLTYNLSVLAAFSVLSGFIDSRYPRTGLSGKVLQGLLFGTVAIIGMLYPFVLDEGIFFDGRSVVISLCTLFFGPISGILSALMAAFFRFYKGGGGILMGEMVILTSFVTGFIFYKWRLEIPLQKLRKRNFYYMGLIIHFLMVFYMLFLPVSKVWESINTVGLTVIAVYPLVTVIIGKILLDQEMNLTYLAEISKSEQLYRATFYSIGDAVIATDESWHITRMNLLAQKITGWKESEAQGEKLSKVFNIRKGDTGEYIKSTDDYLIKQRYENGSAKNLLLITRNGNDINIGMSIAPITDKSGHSTGSVIVFRDRTQELNHQKNLKDRERQLSTLMSNLPGMVYRSKNDPEWTMTFVSEGSYLLTGLKPEDLLNNSKVSFSQIIHPKFTSYVWSEIQKALLLKEQFQLTYKIVPISGSEKWVWEQGRGIFGEDGELLFIEGFITDITARKVAEEKFQYYNERLKLLSSVTREAIGKLPVDQLVNNMLTEIMNAFKVDSGVIRIKNDEGLQLLTKMNIPDDQIVQVLPVDFGLAAKMFERMSPFSIKNINEDEGTRKLAHYQQNIFEFVSYAGAPLLVKEKVIGILGLYTIKEEKEYSAEDLEHLQIAANHIASAIENNDLFTEIINRKVELENEIMIRKLAEDHLRESEEKLSIIIDSTNIVLYRLNYGNSKYDYISPVIEKVTGYSPHEINEIGFKKLVEKVESISGTDFDAEKLKLGKRYLTTEFRADYFIRKKNGEQSWLSDHSFPWYDDLGNLIGSMGILTDITARKLVEKEIDEQKKKFEKLFQNSPVAIALLDEKNKVRAINESFRNLFDYTFEEIEGKNLDLLIVPEELREEADEMSVSTHQGNSMTRESYRLKKEGTKLFVQIAGVPVYAGGDSVSIYAMYVDLSQRQKAEEEIRQAKERAEEMSRLKSNFLANMSHELRTPLIGILGYSEILESDAEDNSVREMASLINSSGTRLLETLNLILDLSRVEADKLEINIETVDAIQAASEVISLFGESAAKKKLYLRSDFTEQKILLKSDSRILIQILNNLVNNAIKFTQNGGVTVSVSEEGEVVTIKVKDTGIGIADEDQRMIWDEFRQASEGYSRNFEGSGLGLTITKRFVEKLGGKISLTSKLNSGSTFTVELPVEKSTPQLEEAKTIEVKGESFMEQTTQSPVKAKILLVEDDPIAIDLINTMLGARYNIDSVSSALAGIEKANSKLYDLILMDINLGKGMSGLAAVQEIRKIESYKKIPIVAVTAFAMVGDKEEFLAGGCDYYLSKPFKRQQFLDIVSTALQKNSESV